MQPRSRLWLGHSDEWMFFNVNNFMSTLKVDKDQHYTATTMFIILFSTFRHLRKMLKTWDITSKWFKFLHELSSVSRCPGRCLFAKTFEKKISEAFVGFILRLDYNFTPLLYLKISGFLKSFDSTASKGGTIQTCALFGNILFLFISHTSQICCVLLACYIIF